MSSFVDQDALPHDDAVERAVLGSIMLEPSRAMEVASLPLTAFYSDRHKIIFRSIAETIAKYGTIDSTLLARELMESRKLDNAGGAAYLGSLFDGSWTGRNILAYARILRDLERRRTAIHGASSAASLARTEGAEAVRSAFAEIVKRMDITDEAILKTLDLAAAARGEIPDVPWIIEGWFGRGDATVFAGEWATGKSLIALDLALSIAAGLPWMGRMRVGKPMPVLYLDEENNPVNATRRLSRMICGRDMDPERAAEMPLVYGSKNRIKLDSAAGKATVERAVSDHGIGVLILDSFIRFGRMNVNKNDELARFFDDAIAPLIGRYNVSVVMLDHMRKPGDEDKNHEIGHRVTGGADKAGFADNLWVVHGSRDESTRTFEARKSRWEDTLPPPLTTTWNVSEDERAAWVSCSDAALNAEIVVSGLVIEWGLQGIRASDLFEAAVQKQVNQRTARRTVKRLTDSGVIERVEEGSRRVRYYAKGYSPCA